MPPNEERRSEEEQWASDLYTRLERRNEDVERLSRWMQSLDKDISAILGSHQWRAAQTVGGLYRRLRFGSSGPAVEENLDKVRSSFREWRERYEEARVPEPPPLPVEHESPVRPESPAGFTSPDHVLAALRATPPVTIVVPIHNAREDLERCLEALARNTTAPTELLLVDDASTDPGIGELLAGYEGRENVRVLKNEENLGFVESVNRGFAACAGDVVLLNSDAEVTPRWLENLTLAAYRDPRTATVTAISDNAGAFSAPEIGRKNDTPEDLSKDETGRLVTQRSGQVYPRTPTANGFCMYVKRAALDEVSFFDAESFPRGYGEENDFCMRALKLGWNHTVDDTTFVFHRRTASFGEEKQRVISKARAKLDELHPDYTLLARSFVASEDMKRVGEDVRGAFEAAEAGEVRVRPRLLYVIHQSHGGTTFTNEDLMRGVSDSYSPYLLVSNVGQLKLFEHGPDGLELLEEWDLRGNVEVTEYTRPDYRAIVFDILVRYRFELVHVRHLVGHTFDLPEVAALLGVPVVLSFHDFYFSCPTVHLIDDHGKYCGGVCTPGHGQCALPTKRLQQFPLLKHAYLGTWREQVQRMFAHVDAFVTTSRTTKEVHLRSLPALGERPFRVIEHGRDLEQASLATRPGKGKVKVLVPGSITAHKGGNFIRALKDVDNEERLEFHFLGRVAADWRDLGVIHGRYQREEFNERVGEISPSFMGIFSIWPETYCHTLTEAWAAGVPVLASDIGTLRERVNDHGGGWLLDFENPEGSYRRILEIAADKEEYDRELRRADLHGIRTVGEMSGEYKDLYETVLGARRRFERWSEVSGAL